MKDAPQLPQNLQGNIEIGDSLTKNWCSARDIAYNIHLEEI